MHSWKRVAGCTRHSAISALRLLKASSSRQIRGTCRMFIPTGRCFSVEYKNHINGKNYYDVLRVRRSASQDEIKAKYIEQAKIHHPDTKGDEADDVEFKKISEAYNVLSDLEEKNKYDRIIGNYDADEQNVYKDLGKKDFMYKKTHGLDEEELKEQETEHQKILKRKHQRQADLVSRLVKDSLNRVVIDQKDLDKLK